MMKRTKCGIVFATLLERNVSIDQADNAHTAPNLINKHVIEFHRVSSEEF